jgi:hypothetical protein
MDLTDYLGRLPFSDFYLLFVGFAAVRLWANLPAFQWRIRRRLRGIKDEELRLEVKVRLLNFAHLYSNRNDVVTNHGFKLAIEHAKEAIHRDRRNRVTRSKQIKGIIDF